MSDLITSTGNPRVVQARKLAQRKHRIRQDRFAAEGLQVLRMALEALESDAAQRIRPLEVFFCEEAFTSDTAPQLVRGLTQAGAQAFPVATHVLEALSSRELSQGLVAVFEMSSMIHSLTQLRKRAPRTPRLVLVLDRPQYPGNVGTLIRTADAVGAESVILIEPATDALDPKAVRASMGSLFAVPLGRTQDVASIGDWGREAGLRWIGSSASQGELVWDSSAMVGSVGLILGNEGEGLDPAFDAFLQATVRLPQCGGAESLNVSVAGGVLMYEWFRRNRPEV